VATVNERGNVLARCLTCSGALTTFLWRELEGPATLAHTTVEDTRKARAWERFSVSEDYDLQFRLFRCASCGSGALGVFEMDGVGLRYPEGVRNLLTFIPELGEPLALPDATPDDIRAEFREAERCIDAHCFRGAAALFRSVLDKVLRAHGYKAKRGTTLEQQVDAAHQDGIITESRKRRAHEEVRVLGNDVLHDEWRQLDREDVEPAHLFTQRIVEDFYNDPDLTQRQLREKGRLRPEHADE
jgi:hypothetical protein